MKKTLLSVAFVAACLANASAQKITLVPFTENPGMQTMALSANGKYVGGTSTDQSAFMYNAETGELKYFIPTVTEDGTDNDANVYGITNDGKGVGYIDNVAATFDFATGTATKVLPEGEDGSLFKFVTANGDFMAGSSYNSAYTETPFYMVDGVRHDLPTPTDEWLGFETNGFSVYGGNTDGSVILGYAIDNFETHPLVVWVKNSDGESYSVETLCRQYVDESFELDGPQPYDCFEGAAVSENGEWVAINLHDKEDADAGMVIGRLNLKSGNLELIECVDGSANLYYWANSIANDGTIVGYTEDQVTNARRAFICKGGETITKTFLEAFPSITEFATMDNYDFNSPNVISPDGRYIAGFGYVDYSDESLAFAPYILDTQASSDADGVNAVVAEGGNKVVSSYGIDGKKVPQVSARRLTVNRYSNGKVKKVVK